MPAQIRNKTINIDGIDIFYRETGEPVNPSLLLLHGFPSSSVMFRNLMTALSDRFHLVAPDYPGFGFSAFPNTADFEYSFRNIADHINTFTNRIGLSDFTIYLHDYGCPIGLRICMAHPEKIKGIILQNGNAYEEGLGPPWNATREYWENPTPGKKQEIAAFLSEEGVYAQYSAGLPQDLLMNLSPELPLLDWTLMKRTGNIDMQFELNCDYKTNLGMFPQFQEYFRNQQPPALIIWGKYDAFFSLEEAYCYQKDLPLAQTHIIEAGHMALETNFVEVAALITAFMESNADIRAK